MAKDRDERRETQWRRIIRQHSDSGLTVSEFCRKGKLRETAFHFWRRELRRRQAEQQHPTDLPAAPAFVAVRVEDSNSSSIAGRIEIELPGGRRVHVVAPVDRQALADVLAVLRLDVLAALSAAQGEGRPC
jgi:transposase